MAALNRWEIRQPVISIILLWDVAGVKGASVRYVCFTNVFLSFGSEEMSDAGQCLPAQAVPEDIGPTCNDDFQRPAQTRNSPRRMLTSLHQMKLSFNYYFTNNTLQ